MTPVYSFILILHIVISASNAVGNEKYFIGDDGHDPMKLIDERDIFQGGDVASSGSHVEDVNRKSQDSPGILSSGVLSQNNEVVFSVLETSKSKNEVVSIDSRHLHETNASDASASNVSAVTKNKTLTVECILRTLPEDEIPSVFIANSSVLQTVLVQSNITNSTVGECAVVLFFSSQCVFSARMAPHYNALARVFPGIVFYALDTSLHNNIHVRYGIVSVPNVLLFHNAKPVARFNETHFNLENLVCFVTKYTSLAHNGTLNVTSADMNGPVPATLTKRVDYVLILAWIFTLCCLCFWFLKSSLCHKIVECVRNTWLEAEAQHEHTD